MNKSRFIFFLIPFFVICAALGYFAPPEIALPSAMVIFLVSMGIYQKQQQQKKMQKEKSKKLDQSSTSPALKKD